MEISRELGWAILFLIPKGNTDTWGIGLLESLWRVVEAIVDTCLRPSFCLHDILQCFRAGKGTRSAIFELKLAQ